MTVVLTIIAAILIFAVLIFIHELGHFSVAKAVGIKVNEFALGMGPSIFKKQGKETLYALRAFPIGGYCKMEGEDEESDDRRAFNNKPAWARFLVVAAGPIMNFLGAILILTIMFTYIGLPTLTVSDVVPDSPAAEAGMSAGDVILSVNNEEIKEWTDIQNALPDSENEKVNLTVLRGEDEISLETGLIKSEDGRLIMGFTPVYSHNFISSISRGCTFSVDMIKEMLNALGGLFTGRASVDDVVGPIGIISVVKDTVKTGLLNLAYLTALLSLNLGLVNLLPLPALDGGRLVFIVIRKITGKAITDEMEGRVHLVGIFVLFAFMILITFKDVGTFILS